MATLARNHTLVQAAMDLAPLEIPKWSAAGSYDAYLASFDKHVARAHGRLRDTPLPFFAVSYIRAPCPTVPPPLVRYAAFLVRACWRERNARDCLCAENRILRVLALSTSGFANEYVGEIRAMYVRAFSIARGLSYGPPISELSRGDAETLARDLDRASVEFGLCVAHAACRAFGDPFFEDRGPEPAALAPLRANVLRPLAWLDVARTRETRPSAMRPNTAPRDAVDVLRALDLLPNDQKSLRSTLSELRDVVFGLCFVFLEPAARLYAATSNADKDADAAQRHADACAASVRASVQSRLHACEQSMHVVFDPDTLKKIFGHFCY